MSVKSEFHTSIKTCTFITTHSYLTPFITRLVSVNTVWMLAQVIESSSLIVSIGAYDVTNSVLPNV